MSNIMWYHLNYDIIDGEPEDYDSIVEVIEKNCSAYSKILFTGWVIETPNGHTFKKMLTNSTKKTVYCILIKIQSQMNWQLKIKDSAYIKKNIPHQS